MTLSRPAPSLLALLTLLGSCAVPATMLPVPSAEDRAAAAGWGSGTWMDQHEQICRIGRTRETDAPDLVFLGDSITQSWGGPGRAVYTVAPETWERFYAGRRAANFGISGDRTQHLLWRLRHGALDGLRPRAIMILIGTNNVGADAPADIARGMEAVLAEARRRAPEAKVLLGVLPRGFAADDPARVVMRAIQAALRVPFLDLAPQFTNPDGSLRADLYAGDGLHLSPAGYAAWAEAIEPWVADALGDAPRDDAAGGVR